VVSSLSAGGAERVISEMANWWAVHDREVAVLTLENVYADHYRLHPRVRRITIDWQLPRTRLHIPAQYIKHQIMLRGAVLGYTPDVMISFIDRTNIRMLFALAGTGIPIIISERTDPRHHRIGLCWSLVRRLIYPFSDALVVQTDSVASWASRIVQGRKIRVIPNFVRPTPEPENIAEEAQRFESFVLTVGRLGKEKGYDLLIRAFAMAKAAQAGWRLVILGEGPERSNLERLAGNLGIGDAVLMPGIVQEPTEWMRQAAFFVLPSRYEGFPNALLEAMACGCAVIAADCPSGPAEIIRHNVDGLLVPSEDVGALADAMGRLIKDEDLRFRLGQQALAVRSLFSQAQIMAQWENLIEDVCLSRK
jgi:glycosyltransferase involved in cell wall biosynthesis